MRVRGHDGARSIGAAVARRLLERDGNAHLERRDIELLADDARRCHKHLLRVAAHDLGDDAAGLLRHRDARLAGSRVGVTRVDGNCAHRAIAAVGPAQVLAAHGHGRGAEAIGGEHACRAHGLVGNEQREVGALGVLAEAGVDAGGAEALGTGHAP